MPFIQVKVFEDPSFSQEMVEAVAQGHDLRAWRGGSVRSRPSSSKASHNRWGHGDKLMG